MRQAGPHSDNFKLQGVIGYGGCTPSKNDGMQVHQHASRREFQTLNSVEIESSICTRSLSRIGLMLLAFTDPGEKTNCSWVLRAVAPGRMGVALQPLAGAALEVRGGRRLEVRSRCLVAGLPMTMLG
jgi:hypothetical protein